MAVQLASASHPPKVGGQHPPSFVGRFYVNPFVLFNKIPEGFATDFQLVTPAVLPGALLRKTSKPIVTGIPRLASVGGGIGADSRNQFWTERLHLLPISSTSIDLGNLVSDVDSTFEVFNSSRKTVVQISSIGLTAAAGFTFISGKVPPSPELFIGLYGSEVYVLRAEVETGPPTISAVFEWIPVTAGFSSVTVSFIGNRITVFTFEPQFNVTTSYEWLTSVVESFNGTEQRVQMRDRPRESIRYRFRKGDADVNVEEPYPEEATAFEHTMFDSLGRVFATPVWGDRTVLNSAVSINDTVINITTAGLDLQLGELLMLWHDWNDQESQEIASVAAGTVTVSNPFLAAHAIANTVVLPTFTALIDDGIVEQLGKLDTAFWSIVFNRINERTDLLSGISPELPADRDGIPDWPRRWGITGRNLNRTWRRNIQEVQTTLGQIKRSFSYTTPRRAQNQLVANIRGRSDFLAFRQFVLALKGQQKIFWLPSRFHQFRIQATAAGGSSTIRVFNNLYTTFVANRAQLNRINVVLTDGQEFDHTIVSSADIGTPPNNEVDLGITPATSVEYNTTNVDRIEYLTRHRLNTDRVVFEAIRPRDHYTASFPIIEVINET